MKPVYRDPRRELRDWLAKYLGERYRSSYSPAPVTQGAFMGGASVAAAAQDASKPSTYNAVREYMPLAGNTRTNPFNRSNESGNRRADYRAYWKKYSDAYNKRLGELRSKFQKLYGATAEGIARLMTYGRSAASAAKKAPYNPLKQNRNLEGKVLKFTVRPRQNNPRYVVQQRREYNASNASSGAEEETLEERSAA